MKELKDMDWNKLGIILFIISIAYLLVSSYIGLFKANMWLDEHFSFYLVKMPLSSMITAGIDDVHPLLYYFILKAFVKIAALLNITNLEVPGVIASLTPFYLLLVLSYTKIKDNFGLLSAGIFSLCIVSMPQLLRYSIEVRMYGWALLFLTMSYIYIYEINKENSLKKWGILTILSIMSCHTHYFAAVTSFSLYFVFLAYILYKKRELLKNWLLSGTIIVLAYIPWVPSLLYQIHKVHKSYWIDPISIDTIISYFYYVFSPSKGYIDANAILAPDILGSLMLLCFILLTAYYVFNPNEKIGKYPLYGLIAVIIVPTIGVTISLLFSPIFFMRYLILLLGIIWLCFSIFLENIKDKKLLFSIILVFILIVGSISLIDFIDIENANYQKELEMKEVFYQNIPPGSVIIYDSFYGYISSTVLDNNYTAIRCDNLEDITKGDNLQKSDSNKYLKETLHNKTKEKMNDNAEIFIVDTDEHCSKLKELGYDLDMIYEDEENKIYKLNP